MHTYSCWPLRRQRSALLVVVFVLAACLAAPAQQGMFGSGEYARDRVYDLQHIRLDLSFDYLNKKVTGTATLRMEPLGAGLREVTLDSAVNVESVTLAGARGTKPIPLTYHAAAEKLYITLDKAYNPGTKFEVAIKYNAQPKRGLFFVLPDKNYPDRPQQIWSQGEAMDNHYWFPCYDFPNDRTTSEMRVTVPAKWEAVANGRLVSVENDKGGATRTFHWLQDLPHSTYLISLVAGNFEKVDDKNSKVPVSYYTPPKTSADAASAFGRTPNMVQFYSDKIAPYPWAKYTQAVVEDFTAGGMENTSNTTVNRAWLVEKELALDLQKNNDDGISHELAHQWFGDLLTTADWRNLWLNEGFATYFANLWEEHYYGRDEFDWSMLNTARQITGVPGVQSYPIVWRANQESGPYQILIYPKGGFILHMMRHELGDELWWKGIQHYVKKFRLQNVQTHDFIEAMAEATGHNFEGMFEQFVYGPGFPEFELSWDYDAKNRLVHVAVNQTLKRNDKPAPFRVPVDFEVLSDGGTKTYTVWASKETDHFYFPADERPRAVLFDPANSVLKTANFKKDEAEWVYQLQHAPRALNRIEAAVAMRKLTSSPALLSALEQAGTTDKFVGVRAEAANTLSGFKPEASRETLLKMAADADPRVRRNAITALGALKADEATAAKLLAIAKSDASLQTRSTAIRVYADTKPKNVLDTLMSFMEVNSARETIRQAALTALTRQDDAEKAVPMLVEYAKPGKPVALRQTAMQALGRLGKGKSEVRDVLVESLKDGNSRLRMMALNALGQRREASALAAVEEVASSETGQFADMARRVADSLRDPNAPAFAAGFGGFGGGGGGRGNGGNRGGGRAGGGAAPAQAAGGGTPAQPAPAAARPSGPTSPSIDPALLQKRLDELERQNSEMKARLDRLEKTVK